ncbi:DHS-like NAD/FAD-binding domain-containing protein [Obba rivulosa]|uniref:DHS-like NAD/FAD-binding domain-containing protein n=1 Tax=Obba rivulosa TaxID=1052685 RepID=A0A8E2DHU0_9APHY|nr:DHS-like NAD/FAD-binding domain-containing protein [Obba rivulosa]
MISLDLEASSSDASTRRALSNLSLSVAKCKKIVVVTGAGISCSCGIPDFRSSDGLYALVKQQYPDVVLKGRDLFDASLFRNSTSTAVFYTFISQLKRSVDSAVPSPTHRFIKTLDSKRKLLRSYTQNIDGLEERAGLMGSSSEEARSNGKGKGKLKAREVRNVQLHGDIHRVRCTFCSAEFPCTEEYLVEFGTGTPPDCPECIARSNARTARSARAIKVGTLRPAIVLYDEPHPLGDDIGSIQSSDVARKPDMLIIMGTSLKVHGFKKLVKDFAKIVRESALPATLSSSSSKSVKSFAGKVIFVNKTAPGSEWDGIIDYHVEGETDKWAEKVIEDWKKLRPSDWEVQTTLHDVGKPASSGLFTVSKDVTNTIHVKGSDPKARPHTNKENRPPVDIPLPVAYPPAPTSPGKRCRDVCHYEDEDVSPSKRSARVCKEKVISGERGAMFCNTTNTPKTINIEEVLAADPMIPKYKLTQSRGRRTKARVEAVEVPLPTARRTRIRS